MTTATPASFTVETLDETALDACEEFGLTDSKRVWDAFSEYKTPEARGAREKEYAEDHIAELRADPAMRDQVSDLDDVQLLIARSRAELQQAQDSWKQYRQDRKQFNTPYGQAIDGAPDSEMDDAYLDAMGSFRDALLFKDHALRLHNQRG